MRKYIISVFIALIAQQSFSVSTSSNASSSNSDESSKQCETIANACLSAGFEKSNSNGKAFWPDCMKPILLGQTVTGVNVEAKDAIACRKFKILEMQKELKQLQQVKQTELR